MSDRDDIQQKLEKLDPAFIKAFLQEVEGKKISITRDAKTGNNIIRANGDFVMEILPEGSIRGLKFSAVEEIDVGFLAASCDKLEYIYLPKVKKVGDGFLSYAHNLKYIDMPKVQEFGDFCFISVFVPSVEFPEMKKAGKFFFHSDERLVSADFSEMTSIGSASLYNVEALREFAAPKLSNRYRCNVLEMHPDKIRLWKGRYGDSDGNCGERSKQNGR